MNELDMHSCGCCGLSMKTMRDKARHESKCSAMVIDSIDTKRRRRPLNAATRFLLWNSTFGERIGVGACYCCAREVTQQSFEAGHIQSIHDGGVDHVSNLKVVCRSCNASMGTRNMLVFKATFLS